MTEPVDPVTVEIIRNGVLAVTEEMKTNLMRTAYNVIIYEALDFTVGLFTPEGAAMRERYIPLKRAGTLDDCAGAAVFLASSMGSYITGVTLNVDGGTWASSGWTRNEADGWRLFN